MSSQRRLAAGTIQLFDRSRSLRFLIVGLGNTLFSTLVFMALLYLGFGVALGSALALMLGIIFSYYTQGSIVFRHMSLRSFLRFVIAWTVIYSVNLLEIRLLMRFGLSSYAAGALATVPTTIISYFVQKLLVFQTTLEDETRRPETAA